MRSWKVGKTWNMSKTHKAQGALPINNEIIRWPKWCSAIRSCRITNGLISQAAIGSLHQLPNKRASHLLFWQMDYDVILFDTIMVGLMDFYIITPWINCVCKVRITMQQTGFYVAKYVSEFQKWLFCSLQSKPLPIENRKLRNQLF
jgi:hypothetical protein